MDVYRIEKFHHHADGSIRLRCQMEGEDSPHLLVATSLRELASHLASHLSIFQTQSEAESHSLSYTETETWLSHPIASIPREDLNLLRSALENMIQKMR